MATPGTPGFMAQSLATRQRQYQIAQFSAGGASVPAQLYFTPGEMQFIQAASQPTGQWAQDIKAKYPTYAGYLSIPEIGDVLKQAAEHGWQPPEVLSKLQATKWWQSHNQTQRQWLFLNSTDPASAAQALTSQLGEVMRAAAKYGVHVSNNILTGLATNALANGWDQDRIVQELVRLQSTTGEQPTGVLGATFDDVTKLADDYLVPMGPNARTKWTRMIATGAQTAEGLESYLRDQAKSMFRDGGLHRAIDEGMTVKEYADPYVQTAAKDLGLNPNDIDLSQDKWRRALQFTDPNGNKRAMTLDEWGDTIRTDGRYGYDHTNNAMNDAAQVGTKLMELFGRKG